jgi:archaellum biogenesis protein FlaJ (TadC family)
MEQILAFVLGVSVVTFIWVVVVAFRTAKQVTALKANEIEITSWIQRNDELVNRRIDQEINRTDELYNDSIRHTDSRVDKLDSKFCSDGKALTEKSREFLKG